MCRSFNIIAVALDQLAFSRAVLFLMAITHSSPQDFNTVHNISRPLSYSALSYKPKKQQISQSQFLKLSISNNKIFVLAKSNYKSYLNAQLSLRNLQVLSQIAIVIHKRQKSKMLKNYEILRSKYNSINIHRNANLHKQLLISYPSSEMSIS